MNRPHKYRFPPTTLLDVITPNGSLHGAYRDSPIVVALSGTQASVLAAEQRLKAAALPPETSLECSLISRMTPRSAAHGKPQPTFLRVELFSTGRPHLNAIEALGIVHAATGCDLGARLSHGTRAVEGSHIPLLQLETSATPGHLRQLVLDMLGEKLHSLYQSHLQHGATGQFGLPEEWQPEGMQQVWQGQMNLHFKQAATPKHAARQHARTLCEHLSGMLGVPEAHKKQGHNPGS